MSIRGWPTEVRAPGWIGLGFVFTVRVKVWAGQARLMQIGEGSGRAWHSLVRLNIWLTQPIAVCHRISLTHAHCAVLSNANEANQWKW